MPGVYGDHAKPGGWNDMLLDAHFAEKRALEEYTPASNALAGAEMWRGVSETKVKKYLGETALLAAAEARIRYGVQINGFESADAETEFRSFYDSQAQGYAAEIAAEEARAKGIEIVGDFSRPGV